MRAVRKTKPLSGPLSGTASVRTGIPAPGTQEKAAIQERVDRDMKAWNEVNRRYGSVADEFCEASCRLTSIPSYARPSPSRGRWCC